MRVLTVSLKPESLQAIGSAPTPKDGLVGHWFNAPVQLDPAPVQRRGYTMHSGRNPTAKQAERRVDQVTRTLLTGKAKSFDLK